MSAFPTPASCCIRCWSDAGEMTLRPVTRANIFCPLLIDYLTIQQASTGKTKPAWLCEFKRENPTLRDFFTLDCLPHCGREGWDTRKFKMLSLPLCRALTLTRPAQAGALRGDDESVRSETRGGEGESLLERWKVERRRKLGMSLRKHTG